MTLDFQEDKQKRKIDELHFKEAEELAQVLADKYGLPYIDLSKVSINTDALRMIPETDAHQGTMAAFKITGKNVHIAILTPNNSHAQEIIDDFQYKNLVPVVYMCSQASLDRAWERYAEVSQSAQAKAGMIEISDELINEMLSTLTNVDKVKQSLKEKNDAIIKDSSGISGFMETIMAGAVANEGSDIHIEPQDANVRLRYRLDGVLHDIFYFDRKIYTQILSRIKLLSGLRLNVKTIAQDGRFSIRIGKTEMEIRTSILPGNYGESIVMRVLNPDTIAVDFETLGIDDQLFDIFDREIRKPNGMVLLTGPTGSGKTTTLYAFLRRVNDPGTKIVTIENPIEYHLQGITQTQVDEKRGYTFLSGLRSTLRQDPDIIMVGEIRDSETASTAINASLTGHMVFSTLHTNNAAGTIPRLIDLGINPKILTSALTLPIAQRLVRKLCPKCREAYEPSTEERDLIAPIIPTILKKKPNLSLPELKQIWRPKGCPACNNTGYRGRQGVFEAIIMDDAIAEATLNNPSEKELKIASIPQGILDMRQDGITKILQGITSLEELGRVVDLYEEAI